MSVAWCRTTLGLLIRGPPRILPSRHSRLNGRQSFSSSSSIQFWCGRLTDPASDLIGCFGSCQYWKTFASLIYDLFSRECLDTLSHHYAILVACYHCFKSLLQNQPGAIPSCPNMKKSPFKFLVIAVKVRIIFLRPQSHDLSSYNIGTNNLLQGTKAPIFLP